VQDFATIHSSETTSLRISTATTSQDWQRQARWFHRCGTEDENGNSGYTTAVLRCGLVFLQKYIPPKKIRTPCVIICLSVIVFFKDQGAALPFNYKTHDQELFRNMFLNHHRTRRLQNGGCMRLQQLRNADELQKKSWPQRISNQQTWEFHHLMW